MLEGDHYVLNGSKCFITNGNVADTFVVFAMTDKSKGNHGISAFIVEKELPRLLHRQAREEDGHPRLLHLRPDL